VLAVLALFILLKIEALATLAGSAVRGLTGQDTTLASSSDLRWLGFSYIAFRLLHALFECRNGKMPALTLREFFAWVIFFPALVAGPIDRAARFAQDLRAPLAPADPELRAGLGRIASGLAKKFVMADSLALFCLNEINAAQVNSTGWLWILLYAYALRLYLDFSGYTDLAIGIGNLFGVRLPENFNAPYLRPNLTQFWNSWHMSLAQWFRAHFFNPVTRALRASPHNLPPALIILITQLATMLLIGAWHGLSAGYIIWGFWHGAGLFVHNRWSEWMRPRMAALAPTPRTAQALQVSGAILTFHYVALGWVWFAIASPQLSWSVLMRLLAFA
jgi:D-alanyl-lipoteichoic acid acyltransferase DltB (MBOAT superfamily)